MLNEIQMVYGFLDEETKQWVENNLKYLTESEKANYLDALKKEYPARKGTPTKEVLEKIKIKITGKGSPIYYWAVCLECGCEYDYSLPKCPDCYHKDLLCTAKAVRLVKKNPTQKLSDTIKPVDRITVMIARKVN